MAHKKTQPKKIISRGQISPVLVVGVLLVIVVVFAGWVYMDNRNETANTEQIPAAVQDTAQNPLEALPQNPEGAAVPAVGP